MRKYIIGAVFGFLLAVPFTAFGEQISSMVGKQIKGEHPVIANGKTLSKKAISIDGTTYAPLRSVADAVGYDIAFTNNTVILSNPSLEGDLVDTSTPAATITHYFTLETIDAAIESTRATISSRESLIAELEKQGGATDVTKKEREGLAVMQKELERLEGIKAELQAQTTTP